MTIFSYSKNLVTNLKFFYIKNWILISIILLEELLYRRDFVKSIYGTLKTNICWFGYKQGRKSYELKHSKLSKYKTSLTQLCEDRTCKNYKCISCSDWVFVRSALHFGFYYVLRKSSEYLSRNHFLINCYFINSTIFEE